MQITNAGYQQILSRLLQEKEDLTYRYCNAIKNGENYESLKTLYIILLDVNRKLRDFF